MQQPLVFRRSPLQFSGHTNLFRTKKSQSDNPARINNLKPDNSTRSLARIGGKFGSGYKDKNKDRNKDKDKNKNKDKDNDNDNEKDKDNDNDNDKYGLNQDGNQRPLTSGGANNPTHQHDPHHLQTVITQLCDLR